MGDSLLWPDSGGTRVTKRNINKIGKSADSTLDYRKTPGSGAGCMDNMFQGHAPLSNPQGYIYSIYDIVWLEIDGAWEPDTSELFRCSQLLPRALDRAESPKEVVQHLEGPAVVVLTQLWSAVGCEQDAKGHLGQTNSPLK